MKSSIKSKFLAAFDKFDKAIEKNNEASMAMIWNFQECHAIGRAERYSDVKNLLITTKKKYENIPFLNKLLLSPNHADWISRYVGGTTALSAFKTTLKLGKYTASVAASLGLLNFLQPQLEMGNKLNDFVIYSGLLKISPMTATAAVVIAGFTAYGIKKLLKMYEDGRFQARSNTLAREIMCLAITDGQCASPKLDKLLKAYEQEFKPDFTIEEIDKIRHALFHKKSESGFISNLPQPQQDLINKVAAKLKTIYFVPDHLIHNFALTMLVEADGNAKALNALLNSRKISDDWINRFKMDPLAIAEIHGPRLDHSFVEQPARRLRDYFETYGKEPMTHSRPYKISPSDGPSSDWPFH
jgi:hypothetical protein